jgi:tRNA-2-methylthio-N6-dimethylallyladenosine synthase
MLPQLLARATRAQLEAEEAALAARVTEKAPPVQPGRGIMMLDFPVESKFDFFPEENEPRGPAAFLAIQEGCDKFCTYCVVPYTRGVEFSRPVKQVADEARRMVLQGTRELTLLGQNVNAYHGRSPHQEDAPEWGLPQLVTHLAETLSPLGLKRLRYTTSYPREITDELVAMHRDVPLLMPFLHLPVQSGSDKVLKEMNRKHTSDFYRRLIEKFRLARPDIAFSSDFIVGFPGETDQDFADTLRLIEDIGFAQAYSFKYSPRPGTPAANRKDQVAEEVKRERLIAIQALLNRQQLAFNASMVGQTTEILIERRGSQQDQWIGKSPYMQSVHVVDATLKPGDYLTVQLHKAHGHSIAGVRPPQVNAA